MSLDEDDRIRSGADVERFLRSIALGADYLTETHRGLVLAVHLVRWRRRVPRGDV
jgi:hypothetical protein